MEDPKLTWSHDIDSVSALMQKMSEACLLWLSNAYSVSLLPDCHSNKETENGYPLIGNPLSASELKEYMEDASPRIKNITQQTVEGRRSSRRFERRLFKQTFPRRNPCKRKELKDRRALLRRKKEGARLAGARVLLLRRLRVLSVRMDSELERRRLACCLGF